MGYWLGLQVQMLGEFNLTFEGKPLNLGMKQTAKPIQLLQILLEACDVGVSRRRLIESLFDQESEDDGARSLNVAVSRLRRTLKESGLPDENYIQVRADRYFFECPFRLTVDTQEVERLRRAADLAKGQDRLSYLYELCDLYYGRFLPELDGEDWAEIIRAHYQRIFRVSMDELCQTLDAKHAYSEILRLTEFAATMFPFEEWQVWQLKSELALGRVSEARKLYRDVEHLYAQELDAPLPEEMRALMVTDVQNWRQPESPEAVAQRIERARQNWQKRLPLPSLLAACGFVVASEKELEPSGAPSTLTFVLVTLELASTKEIERVIGAIEGLLGNKGIYARYSRTQFIVAFFSGERSEAERFAADLSKEKGVSAGIVPL